MASQAQFEANRRNAKKSTGPVSVEGRSVAKLNAVKHGLTSESVVIPGEDSDELDKLRSELENELEPMGRQECDLVETIAICMWRRRRIYRMEANILAYERAEAKLQLAERDKRRIELSNLYCEDYSDDEETEEETDDEEYEAAAARVVEYQRELDGLATSSAAFLLGSRKYTDALEKILRYETAIDRSLGRARDQLARLQRDRQEKAMAKATVIDGKDLAE